MFDLTLSESPDGRKRHVARARNAKTDPIVTSYAEIDGVGMGVLSDGEPFVTQRGLAALCGVQNAHIGTISRDWMSDKPRCVTIRERLGFKRAQAHRVLVHDGHRLFAYDAAVAQAVVDYYAHDVSKAQAIRTAAQIGRTGLRRHILQQFEGTLAPPEPLRFAPVAGPDSEAATDTVTSFLTYVWSLYVLGFWMAVNHIEELRQRAAKAPWNRLGLYLPLKAFLEIQAEVLRRSSPFTLN